MVIKIPTNNGIIIRRLCLIKNEVVKGRKMMSLGDEVGKSKIILTTLKEETSL